MSATALKTMRDALKRGVFDGVYYICGEDDFQKEDAVRQLIAAAIEPAMRDFNMEVRRAQDFDAKALDAALSAVPIMADRRVILIKDASALRKDARKVLDRYLEKPEPDVMLLLVEASGGKTDAELARNSTPLEFDSLSADRIPKWITHYASIAFQARITPEAAELLQGAVGTDLHQLTGELDKLASYTNGREIGEEDVSAVVGVRRGETMADFLDQVAARNAARALELVPLILSQPKTSAVSLIMALATQTMALSWGRARLDEGLPQSRLQNEYFNLLKQSGSAFTGRPWGSAAAAWSNATSRWTARSLDRALTALLDADVALKESRVSSEEQVLATLVLSICIEDDRSIAA
ncbi:MAG TPA: DNA polymerase III subunit delta [Gemmatimonadaceae bacterium]|nr:DNA polymerase III subunit delta [Gemmatimonadaceae bacterium]